MAELGYGESEGDASHKSGNGSVGRQSRPVGQGTGKDALE